MNDKFKWRREVASALQGRIENCWGLSDFEKTARQASYFQDIKDIVKGVLGKGNCFTLLAYLIEPDTCVMSFVEEEMMEATYRCSNCNGTVNTLALYGYEFPFCPYCGAKVERVDDSENPARKYGLANQCGQGPAATESDAEHVGRHPDRDCCHQSSAGCCREES